MLQDVMHLSLLCILFALSLLNVLGIEGNVCIPLLGASGSARHNSAWSGFTAQLHSLVA